MSVITHLLVDLANIERLQEVSMGSGRFEKQFVTISSGTPFRAFVASAKEQAIAQQLRMNLTHKGYCEQGVDIGKDDQVVIYERSGQSVSPLYYRVIGIPNPSLPYFQQLQLEEIVRAK